MEVLLRSYSEQKEYMGWKKKMEVVSIFVEYSRFAGNFGIFFGMESILAAFPPVNL
jgi:hypothetical protein